MCDAQRTSGSSIAVMQQSTVFVPKNVHCTYWSKRRRRGANKLFAGQKLTSGLGAWSFVLGKPLKIAELHSDGWPLARTSRGAVTLCIWSSARKVAMQFEHVCFVIKRMSGWCSKARQRGPTPWSCRQISSEAKRPSSSRTPRKNGSFSALQLLRRMGMQNTRVSCGCNEEPRSPEWRSGSNRGLCQNCGRWHRTRCCALTGNSHARAR